jgi:nucleoporin POM152
MDQTPRLRSAFPQTPRTARRSTQHGQHGASPTRPQGRSSLPPTIAPATLSTPTEPPLIPEHILDAPTQRLFAFSIAIFLWSLRIYDWFLLTESEEQSLWLFMKWVVIDGTFLFGLPGLRIPWLEWSSSTMVLLFCVHAFADAMLMFRIPIPIGAGLAAIWKSVHGAYEMALNEHEVNPESVRFNDSLILGRQIIHILPEGSAELNPERQAFCLDLSRTEVKLPIKINATNPIAMELLRTDLETQQNDTIYISKSTIKTMHKDASRLLSYSSNPNEPKTLYYTVKKPGLYVLSKVVDESNLEVARKRLAHTVIVPCPQAAVVPARSDRCKGEVSDLKMQVIGTPPLTLKYRKTVNGTPQEATFENIQPEEFSSPLTRQNQHAMVLPNKMDTAWARPQTVTVPLGESLDRAGKWIYAVEEVKDAFGNRVSYSAPEHTTHGRQTPKRANLNQIVNVHERPTVSLKGCTPQQPLKIAKGVSAFLPVQYGSTGRGELSNTTYHLNYVFSPTESISEAGEHTAPVRQKPFERKALGQQPRIEAAGLYTLTGISTDFCAGEVFEPASCLLQNPPEPSLSLTSEELSDKCAGRPVGLSVNLDLTGTPPFKVKYRVASNHIENTETESVEGLRAPLELKPRTAGHYTYEFLSISDAVYKDRKIKGLKLEQDVKPSASAHFVKQNERKIGCIEDPASFDVQLQGEPPFILEYELVHGGKRKKYTLDDLRDRVKIVTEPLVEGGDYTLAIVSVTDAMRCKEFPKGSEASIRVRYQKPRVGFRTVDSEHSISTVERKNVLLPLRLEGDGPWKVRYRDPNGREDTFVAKTANERIPVSTAGKYELLDVSDDSCPGVVDGTASSFDVAWIPRPEMRIVPSESVEQKGPLLIKAEVCEGDEDALEVLFKGSPPFELGYTQSLKLATRGTMAEQNKDPLRSSSDIASMRMDTRMAGTYEYTFFKLSDHNYDHSSQHFKPFSVQQNVNARPSAAFSQTKNAYRFCSVESSGEEDIPITLHGAAPFSLELEIKHLGSGRPEIISLTDIKEKEYHLKIPHSRLHTGRSSIYLRRVSDAKGCIRSLDSTTPGVQISVHDAPTITELEPQKDFCVGDRINFALSGVAPFTVFYEFEGKSRKATVSSTTFRRFAEKPGVFTITGVADSASKCQSSTRLSKVIHGLPSAQISKGKESYIDIHEGGSTEIQFDFGGTPPFEFTYTRSANTEKGGKKRGDILDMRSEISDEHSLKVRASEEGTYEVVSVRDRYCGYARPGIGTEGSGRKRLTY